MDSESFSLASHAIVIPLLSVVVLLLDLPPFAWHVKNRNLGAASLIFWIILANIFTTVNALIWPNADLSTWWHGQILCDVEVKLGIGSHLGICGSLVCTMRSLAQVLNTSNAALSPSKAQRRKQLIIDIMLCFGFPAFEMAIHYVIQPSRYYIFPIGGCTISFDNSWPSIVIYHIWAPILCFVVVYYALLVIIRMRKYRQEFAEVLRCSNSNMTRNRFLRLFLLSIAIIVVFLPLELYVLVLNTSVPLLPYDWAAIHGPDWSDIILVVNGGQFELITSWLRIAIGYVVFGFFGVGKDAVKMYRNVLLMVGLGRIFPSLRSDSPSSSDSLGSKSDSFSSKARMLFRKKRSSGHSTATFGNTRRDSTNTEVFTPSPTHAEKTFLGLSTILEDQDAHGSTSSMSSRNRWLRMVPLRSTLSWVGRLGTGSRTSMSTTETTAAENQMHEHFMV